VIQLLYGTSENTSRPNRHCKIQDGFKCRVYRAYISTCIRDRWEIVRVVVMHYVTRACEINEQTICAISKEASEPDLSSIFHSYHKSQRRYERNVVVAKICNGYNYVFGLQQLSLKFAAIFFTSWHISDDKTVILVFHIRFRQSVFILVPLDSWTPETLHIWYIADEISVSPFHIFLLEGHRHKSYDRRGEFQLENIYWLIDWLTV